MKKWILIIILLLFVATPVCASQIEAPEVPPDVSDLMPHDEQSFAEGVWYVFVTALQQVRPDIRGHIVTCVSIFCATLLISFLRTFPTGNATAVDVSGVVCICLILLQPTGTVIRLGVDTVQELCQYGQLLLPVMTAALAAQGGTSASVALYAGTAFVNALLSRAVSTLVIPMVYIYLVFCLINSVTGQELLGKLSANLKSIMTWCLKAVIYVFTGYIGITGVISGTTDQATLKVAKMTIAGAVPVVGNMLSDASQTILLSASVLKNAAGVYGIYAMLAITVVPFLRIGIPYILLKLTAALCGTFSDKKCSSIIEAFCGVMGFLLAITGTVCVIELISTVCFMKGMG